MKKLVFVLSLLLFSCSLAFSSQSAEAAKTAEMYVNAKSDIILRTKPAQQAERIGTIKNHSKLTVLSSSNGWSYVHTGKHKGYVYTSALSAKNPKAASAPAPTTVTTGLRPVDGLTLTYAPSFGEDKRETFVARRDGESTELYNKQSPLYPLMSNYIYIEDSYRLIAGVSHSDVLFIDVNYPMKQGSYISRNILVESTTKTIKVKAGSFRNVVILRYPNGARDYLAKGIGIIKTTDSKGKIITELVSYSAGK